MTSFAFFGGTRAVQDITEADGDEFWRYLLRCGLSNNTARRICGRAKQLFRFAVRKRLIAANPFADLKYHVQANPEREYFMMREQAGKVFDACNDPQWRLLFALSRYGGLRCPSEHLALRWADVDWGRARIRVLSPKTGHHEGKDCRYLPLFPELRPYLLDAFERAEPGTEHVITMHRDANANLRTQLLRIIERAGLSPWPKLFHNLRASRQTELAERFPDPRRVRVARQLGGGGEGTLSPGHGRTFRPGVGRSKRGERIRFRGCGRLWRGGAKSGAASGGKPTHGVANGSPQSTATPGNAGGCGALPNPARCGYTPKGSRTPVCRLRICRPRPLDDGGVWLNGLTVTRRGDYCRTLPSVKG